MDRLKAAGDPLGLPEIEAGSHLVLALLRLGPVRSTGMGDRPTDWPEIAAFAHCTGRISEPWEAETLHHMAGAFYAEMKAGEDPFRIAPVERE